LRKVAERTTTAAMAAAAPLFGERVDRRSFGFIAPIPRREIRWPIVRVM
jgi:hypothetical protein